MYTSTHAPTHVLPGAATSLWLDTTMSTNFPRLQSDISVDVAIVGGGIAGLTAATLLKAEGKRVAVLEADRIVEGVTGYTTAKITSLHTLIYDYLLRKFGKEKARAYANANQSAIEQIAYFVRERQIECDFTRTQAYTYTESADEVKSIEAEVEAAIELGLPATYVSETPLPFPIEAAVRFDNQALFHPRKYLLALAEQIPDEHNFIFEKTRVTELTDGEPCTVTTEHGTATARSVIIASHFPFNDKALYSTRLTPHRSYVLAVRLDQPAPKGMFISTRPSHTLRYHPSAGDDLMLVGGEGHTTGHGGDSVTRYQRVEAWARERFPVRSVEYHWSTQDNGTLDQVPYIGYASPASEHVYVATGFGGWGMTNGTVAGILLCDLIMERDNPWADVYAPNRVNLTGAPKFVKQMTSVARRFIGDRLKDTDKKQIGPGEGKIVQTDDGDVAMSMAEDGTVTTLSAACTHMGCLVQWNPAERSWDCPCHGSRFGADGKVIHGPAIEDLERINLSVSASS